MAIFSLDTISLLIREIEQPQHSSDKQNYLRRCFEIINDSILDHFGSSYLFHRAYYMNGENKFTWIDPEIKMRGQLSNKSRIKSGVFKKNVAKIERAIVKGTIPSSFTELLYNGNKLGLCLFKTTTNQEIRAFHPDFLFFNVLTDRNKLMETFFNQEPGNLDILTKRYQETAKGYPNLYIYFIRPFTNMAHFSGAFTITLKSALSPDDYKEIAYLWTKILTEMAIMESREEEQTLILEEYTHTSRTELMALRQYQDRISYEMRKLFKKDQLKDLNVVLRLAEAKVGLLHEVMAFNLLMMRKGEQSSEPSSLDKDNDIAKKQDVNINKLLVECIDSICAGIEVNRKFSNANVVERELDVLQKIRRKINRAPNIIVYTSKTGLMIMFNDLLKNALKHSGKDCELDIKIKKVQHRISIHFKNQMPLSQDMFDYINNGQFSSTIFLNSRFGVRTIKRILESEFFNTKLHRWSLNASSKSLKGPTEIYLLRDRK